MNNTGGGGGATNCGGCSTAVAGFVGLGKNPGATTTVTGKSGGGGRGGGQIGLGGIGGAPTSGSGCNAGMSGGTIVGALTTIALGGFAHYIYSSDGVKWFHIG